MGIFHTYMFSEKNPVTLRKEDTEDVNHQELALINQGAYGCIFHPGINCRGKKENIHYITKIQKNAASIQREVAIAQYIVHIPRYIRFFSPIIKQCPVKIERKWIPSIQKCELFSKMTESELTRFEYVSNKVRYVGERDLRDYVYAQRDAMTAMNSLIECHAYLCKAFDKLAKEQILHMDVKYNNLMYDEKLKRPIVIDFGISVHLPSLKTPKDYDDAFYVFDSYYVWTAEIMACNYMFSELGLDKAKTTIVTEPDLKRVIEVFLNGYNGDEPNAAFYETIFANGNVPVYVEKYRVKCEDFFKQYVGHTWMEMYEDFLANRYYETWDNYGLAVTCISIMRNMQKKWQEILLQTPLLREYLRLLESVLVASPKERMSAKRMHTELLRIQKAVAKPTTVVVAKPSVVREQGL